MQFLLCGQKCTIPTVIMVIVHWKSAIQDKAMCLAYNSLGLWDREVSAAEGQTIKTAWEQVVLMLLHFICILKISQIEVFLLQTTLTSPESPRNARHEWGTIILAPQEITFPMQKQMWKGHIAWERWHQKVKPHQTLIRQTKSKLEKFWLDAIWPNWASSQVTRSWNKNSVRVYLV